MKHLRFLLSLWLLGAGLANASECPHTFINPLTDVSWRCMFPIRVGGIAIGPQGDNNDSGDGFNKTLCTCHNGPLPTAGVGISFWDPARIIDTVSDPFCLMPLGLKLYSSSGGKLGGSYHQDDGNTQAFQQLHYFIFPTWNILGFFYDIPCIAEKSFDVALMTEVMPQWNNDILALIINPEALLFANPVSALACSADSSGAIVGRPINALFWCMGSWGNAYPLAGSITATDYITANAGIAARGIYTMARLGLLRERNDDGCSESYVPIWHKDHYKLQMMAPVHDQGCRPIGQTGLLWDQNKQPPIGGDNFMWMQFRRMQCCEAFSL